MEEPIYAEPPVYSEDGKVAVNPGLTPEMEQDAIEFAPFAQGVCYISGLPGSGKDTFANFWSKKVVTYYPGRISFRDEPPCKPYGFYYLFNQYTMMQELKMLSKWAGDEFPSDKVKDNDKGAENAAETIMDAYMESSEGKSKFDGAVILWSEAMKYLGRRRQMTRINWFCQGITRHWRHHNMLIMASSQLPTDLDPTWMKFVTYEVRCSWNGNYTAAYHIRPCQLVDPDNGIFQITGKVKGLRLNGKKPQTWLVKPEPDTRFAEDDPNRFYYCAFDLFNSKSKMNIMPNKGK
jgi:hypothetical protein